MHLLWIKAVFLMESASEHMDNHGQTPNNWPNLLPSNKSPISCKCWPPKMSSKTFATRHVRRSRRPQDIKSFSFLQSNSFIKASKGQRQHQALRTCDVTWRELSCVRVCSSEFQVPPSHGNPDRCRVCSPCVQSSGFGRREHLKTHVLAVVWTTPVNNTT